MDLCNNVLMATTSPKKSTKKPSMSDAHKAALATGREEGRIVRRYLDALDASRPRRGRKRSPESIAKRIAAIDAGLDDADSLSRLHMVEERQQLVVEQRALTRKVDTGSLEKEFVRVARSYSERKGISYSAWRKVGVQAAVLDKAKIPRTRS